MKLHHIEQEAVTGNEIPNALGKTFSRRATWATDDPEKPYYTVTVTAFTTGWILDRDAERIEEAESTIMALGIGGAMQAVDIESLPVHPNIAGPLELSDYPHQVYFLELFEEEQVEMIYHTDPDDPGGSEVDSDYEYNGIGITFKPSLYASQRYCKDYVENHIFDYFTP